MADLPECYTKGRYRTRSSGRVTFPIFLGDMYYDWTYPYGDGPWTYGSSSSYDPGLGSTDSVHEICIDELHAGPPYRTGGPFNNWTFWTDQWEAGAGVVAYNWYSKYVGQHVVARLPSSYLGYASFDAFASSEGSTDQLHPYGVTGWNRFRPTRPTASLGVFLGESHEIPRMLRTTAKQFYRVYKAAYGSKATRHWSKAVANDWLNTQFGWLPFLADLRDCYKTSKSLDTRLKQLRRDNGRWIRRGGTVAVDDGDGPEEVYYQSGNVGLRPALATGFYNTPYGESSVTRQTMSVYWMEGAFRYWIPPTVDWLWKAKATAMLFGLRPSPSLIWELTPWSWLIDWYKNMGQSLANMDSILFDNLCAKYAYVMGTKRVVATSTGMSNYKTTGPVTLTRSAYFESKARRHASPFGFGLTSDQFSGRQWSILGALGLTRLR